MESKESDALTQRSSLSATDRDIASLKNSRKLMVEIRDNRLYKRVSAHQRPIVYSDIYNISFFSLEKLHPFDARKWGNVYKLLTMSNRLPVDAVIEPEQVTYDDLRVVHSAAYLRSLKIPCSLAKIVEVEILALIPYCIADWKLLKAMRYQTGGSILAARLALKFGWAINLGGGFHHASATHGGGFCVYADITLALKFLFLGGFIRRAMIIDLDAHQGNGHERDFKGNENVYIFDMFNASIYPHDFRAKEAIQRAVPLRNGISGPEYMCKLDKELELAFEEFTPELIVYNAGTDCLSRDPLGLMDLSALTIIERDELVFAAARERQIPIVMLTSGGYLRESAKVIADSILNLDAKGLIQLDPAAASSLNSQPSGLEKEQSN